MLVLRREKKQPPADVPDLGAAIGFLKAEGHINASLRFRPHDERLLLFLKSIFFAYSGLEQGAQGFIFGVDEHARFFSPVVVLCVSLGRWLVWDVDNGATTGRTHLGPRGGAKAGASVEPVIVAEFVDLDTPPIGRLMRHLVCHHRRRRLGPAVGSNAIVKGEEVGRDVEVLLEGEFGIGGAEEGKRRHGGRREGSRRARDELGRMYDTTGWRQDHQAIRPGGGESTAPPRRKEVYTRTGSLVPRRKKDKGRKKRNQCACTWVMGGGLDGTLRGLSP